MNARDLTLSLRGRWQGQFGVAPCPACQPEGRRDQRALTLADKRGGQRHIARYALGADVSRVEGG